MDAEKTTDAVEILHRYYVEGDSEMEALIQEERIRAEVAAELYQLRTQQNAVHPLYKESIMPDDKTLLAHLVLKLAPHPENIAVEALGHILSMSPAAVRALEDMLRTGGAEVGEIAKVKTQASGEEGTRPDLAGFDQHNKERVLIEAKFWAGLTDKQPVAYLKRLQQNQASALLFIAPAERFESLWTELHRRVKEAKIELVLGHEETNLRSATVGGERRLMLISWAALLGRMVSWASTAGESHTEYDIQQLRGLAEQMDEDAFLPLRPEELGPEFPRRLKSLWRLVKDVVECLEWRGLAEKNSRGDNNRSEYGWYLKLSRTGVEAWFGLDCNRWAAQNTPSGFTYIVARSPSAKYAIISGGPAYRIRPNLLRGTMR